MRKYNILLDALPTTVEVGGTEYPIETDFRIGIQFEMLLGDRSIQREDKVLIALQMYYGKNIPRNIGGAVDAIVDFYRCGVEPDERKTASKSAIGKRRMDKIYDFDADAALFYAAFLDQYRVDLNEAEIHWWKFMAMFEGLRRDHEIQRIMQIRGTDLASIENQKERQRIMRLQEIYRLDAGLTTEEKTAIAGSVFG
ncbi:MAG: bacteriophage Gp15 family protein [Lachnospiraceae bacterium]|nr:bacteriophage Gp15 family protein [Lachnospiraceae bacterium]